MKPRFSLYVKKLDEALGYGITHLEDLDVESFINAVERLHEYDVVQKLDGANLVGGLDQAGKLFASREQKGGKRFYDEDDFPKTSNFDAFRAAYGVLKRIEDELRTVIAPGESFSLEVLFGDQPNTVFYGKDRLNYLAFLEMVPGDDPTREVKQHKIDELMKLVGDKKIAVKAWFSDCTDGVQINRTPQLTDWRITTSDKVSKLAVRKLDVTDILRKLKLFLNEVNDEADRLGMDLTNFEVLKGRERELSEERKRLGEEILTRYKLPIKKQLLSLSDQQTPSLRAETGDTAGAYKGIEGLIFTDPKSRERFKVVDRERFTRVNQFNYQVRKTISGRVTTNNPDVPIEDRGGIVGQARLRAINLFSLEDAEIPSQARRTIEKLRGQDRQSTLDNVVATLSQLNFGAVLRKMQAIYVTSLADLEDSLDTFKINADNYALDLGGGETVKYTPEIRRRTLLSFAEARIELQNILKKLRRARDMHDLVEIFFGKHLDQMFDKTKKRPIKPQEESVE